VKNSILVFSFLTTFVFFSNVFCCSPGFFWLTDPRNAQSQFQKNAQEEDVECYYVPSYRHFFRQPQRITKKKVKRVAVKVSKVLVVAQQKQKEESLHIEEELPTKPMSPQPRPMSPQP